MSGKNPARHQPSSVADDVSIVHGPHLFHNGRMAHQDGQATNKWIVLVIAASSGFMTTLDASIVNIGLPAIARSFQVPLNGTIEWIIISYLVIIAAVLLTFGRLADMVGRKPILVAGLAIFTLGSACCGASPSLVVLIAARVLQGLGAALIFAVNIALVTSTFPASQRGTALGINAVVVSLGISAGPTIGGLITQNLSWRWIFYVNIPVGLLVTLAALTQLTERAPGERGRFDPLGACLLAIGFGTIVLGLSFGQEWGWISPPTVLCFVLGIVGLLAMTYVERRVQHPVLNLVLFRNRVFSLAVVSFTFCQLAIFAVGFLLPFYFEELRGFDAQQSGLLLTPLSLALALVAPFSGALADRIGSRVLSPLGMTIAALGLFLLSQLNAESTLLDIIWRLVLTGVGQGLFLSPNTRTMMGAVPKNEQGEASGIFATGRVLGQSTSVAVGGALFASLGGAAAGNILANRASHLSSPQISALQGTFVNGFHAALLACALIALIGAGTALARGENSTGPR